MSTGERLAEDADRAITELYAAHARGLVRLSVLLVRDVATAEEVVQDAFIAVHRRWSALDDPDRALAYLRRAVVNGSTSVLRRRGTAQRYLQREAAGGEPVAASSEGDVVARERRAAVLAALESLPTRQREVLALRYYLDLSEAQIAETLGISRGAVKSHAFRGAAHLRAALADYLEDPS
jgi:RNA polymerase sigma-70 factor (sigma-E family)